MTGGSEGRFLSPGDVSISSNPSHAQKSICGLLSLLGRSQSANGLEGLPACNSAMSVVTVPYPRRSCPPPDRHLQAETPALLFLPLSLRQGFVVELKVF